MTKERGVTPAMLIGALTGRDGTPEGIERAEKQGQQELVNGTHMPLKLDKAAFEALGFKFGPPIDACFQAAELPPGWTREASDHSMWSYINDETGKRRVAVFYKAAFYDRRASARLILQEDTNVDVAS